ncbi:MAG: hypothetical protein Q8O25_11715 [Sulfurisoma sp.]|nr:hypothetical protein [Sulfurisoma sp.]
MRSIATFLFALLIPFNAAFAAAAGICDAMEGQPRHAVHLGHHAHANDHHDHDDADTADNVDPGGTSDSSQRASEHSHSHVHPLFSSMLSAPIGLNLPIATSAPPPPSAETFVSAIPSQLERPPRATSVV